MQEILHAQHSWLAARMSGRDPLVAAAPSQLPERFRRGGLESAVIVPISVGGKVRGWLGLASTRERPWPRGLLRRLRHIGEILANALDRRRRPDDGGGPPISVPAQTNEAPAVLVLGGSEDSRRRIAQILRLLPPPSPEPPQLTPRRAELAAPPAEVSGGGTLQDMERAHIVGTLEACEWKINGRDHAAERLGLPPSTLRFRMKKLGILRPER